MESLQQAYEENLKLRGKIKAEIPDVINRLDALRDAVYTDGALSAKVKRLIGLVAAIRAACAPAAIAFTHRAIEQGATRAEIMEAVAVVITMDGFPGLAESFKVMQLLDELEVK